MKFLIIAMTLIFSCHAFTKKKITEKDYRELASKAAKCLQENSANCLEPFLAKKIYLLAPEKNWGCKGEDLTSKEYAECIISSKEPYDDGHPQTIKEVLSECLEGKSTKVLVKYSQFQTESGFMCFVEEQDDGTLKLGTINLGC